MLYRPENLETKTTEMLLAAGVVGLGATLVVLLLQALKLWSCSPRSNADEQEVASKVEKRRKVRDSQADRREALPPSTNTS